MRLNNPVLNKLNVDAPAYNFLLITFGLCDDSDKNQLLFYLEI